MVLASQAPTTPKTAPGREGAPSHILPHTHIIPPSMGVTVNLFTRDSFLQNQELDGRVGQNGMEWDGI